MDQRKILTAAKAAVQAALDVTDAAITTSELFTGITSLVATSARSSEEREEVVTSLILCALGLVGSDATNNILQAICASSDTAVVRVTKKTKKGAGNV
jgi:hypothetical protein